jgi:antagonist of KipI
MPTVEPTSIRVIKPGWCTTVQDLGRHGYQHYGVSVSGAMDRLALVIANRLVKNEDAAATLEITLVGPELPSIATVCQCGPRWPSRPEAA